MKRPFLLFILLTGLPLWGQGIFETAVNTSAESDAAGPSINGYIRSTAYINGFTGTNSIRLQSGYGEADLELSTKASDRARAYSDLHFRSGYELNTEFSTLDVREAYLDLFLKKFDIRLGKQIVVWGRADGFNPTNAITPQNTTVRSPEADDMRKAALLLRSTYNISSSLRLEGIWSPVYSPTILAVEMADLPTDISIGTDIPPEPDLKNGLLAGRISFTFSAVDGSFSYVHGYNPMPGIRLESMDMTTGSVVVGPAAYRQQQIGMDFSTRLGAWGLRGEGALRSPDDKHDGSTHYYIPYKDYYYVLGVDRTWGDFSILAQYIGRHIPDFQAVVMPSDPMLQLYPKLEQYNNLFTNQTDPWRHALSFRPSLSLLYETLNLEIFGLYDLTTHETMLMPKVSYQLADALSLCAGGDLYYGRDGTLNDLIKDNFSAIYCELRLEF